MIRLERSKPPTELDVIRAAALIADYKATGASVWNAPFIRDALLVSSNSKCAYCETKLDEESKYMEVDHFRCKKDFEDSVVFWDNLLPACKRCNGQKSAYNVDVAQMIVDPFEVDPKKHLFLHNSRLRWRDSIGRATIDVLYLNQSDRMVSVRAQIADYVGSSLERIREYLEEYISGKVTTRQRNKIFRGMQELLRESNRTEQYSAVTATALLTDPHYAWMREKLVELGIWDQLKELEEEAIFCALIE